MHAFTVIQAIRNHFFKFLAACVVFLEEAIIPLIAKTIKIKFCTKKIII